MALSTFVKISGINNLSDARYCAGMMVDQLGFNTDPTSDNFVSSKEYNEISSWVSGIQFVAEFGQSDINVIKKILQEYTVDYIQIENDAVLDDIEDLDLKAIYKYRFQSILNLNKAKSFLSELPSSIEYVLIDEIDSFNDELIITLKSIASKANLLIGGNFTKENMRQILDQVSPKGIVLTGGEEERPGFKDYDELADILETLEVEVY